MSPRKSSAACGYSDLCCSQTSTTARSLLSRLALRYAYNWWWVFAFKAAFTLPLYHRNRETCFVNWNLSSHYQKPSERYMFQRINHAVVGMFRYVNPETLPLFAFQHKTTFSLRLWWNAVCCVAEDFNIKFSFFFSLFSLVLAWFTSVSYGNVNFSTSSVSFHLAYSRSPLTHHC